MHGAGLTPLQSLQSISSTAAKLLNRDQELGQVAPKYYGDFIAVDENPLEDLDTLRKINLVVQGGTIIR